MPKYMHNMTNEFLNIKTLSCAYLRGISDYLLQRNINPKFFFTEFDLNNDELNSPQQVPVMLHKAMLKQAGELTNDHYAGLHIGSCVKPAHLGALGYSIMSCKNLQEAFNRYIRYESLVSNFSNTQYTIKNDKVILSWDIPSSILDRAIAEEQVASFIVFTQWLLGQEINPSRIKFKHSQPDSLSEYRAITNCDIYFSQDVFEIAWPSEYMKLPLLQYDPIIQGMMDAYAEKLLNELYHDDDFINDIRDTIIHSMAGGEVSLEVVARQLALSPRTLQRRLNKCRVTFKKLLNNIRKELAFVYIVQPQIHLSELAYMLGFSEQTAFQRAFKKWTGVTPSKYRKSELN